MTKAVAPKAKSFALALRQQSALERKLAEARGALALVERPSPRWRRIAHWFIGGPTTVTRAISIPRASIAARIPDVAEALSAVLPDPTIEANQHSAVLRATNRKGRATTVTLAALDDTLHVKIARDSIVHAPWSSYMILASVLIWATNPVILAMTWLGLCALGSFVRRRTGRNLAAIEQSLTQRMTQLALPGGANDISR